MRTPFLRLHPLTWLLTASALAGYKAADPEASAHATAPAVLHEGAFATVPGASPLRKTLVVATVEAMLGLRQAELKAEADVRVTHAQFMAARENLDRYRDSVLADSQKMLEGMRLSYRQGAASLLELLSAQRSADDAYLAFLQAKADLASATVQLQLSTGRKPRL